MSLSFQMLARALVMLLAVANLSQISTDIVLFLIIQSRHLNFGTSSILVSSIRTGPISPRAIKYMYVYASLIFRPIFPNSSFDRPTCVN